MQKFTKIETEIENLIVIKPNVFQDERGFFFESYNKRDFLQIGINDEFVQDNHSKSQKGVLRGLHFQKKNSQGKLIRVIKGKIYDVVVDLRQNSKTFGKYFGIELSEENKLMLYIPKNFAHGFLALEEGTEILYKTTDHYNPVDEYGIIWNDRDLNIDWKFEEYKIKENELILSEKDKKQKSFKNYRRKKDEIF